MKRVIELRVFLQVEVPDSFDEEQAKFYLEENHCLTNHIDAMAAAIAKDDERSVCSLCRHAGATLLPPKFPLDEAFDPERNLASPRIDEAPTRCAAVESTGRGAIP